MSEGKSENNLMQVIRSNSTRLKHKPKEIYEALQCDKESLVCPVIQQVLDNINNLEQNYKKQYSYLKRLIVKSDGKPFKVLQEIPGISEISAIGIISELGSDLSKFKNVKHLCSWVGLCPGNTDQQVSEYQVNAQRGINTYA